MVISLTLRPLYTPLPTVERGPIPIKQEDGSAPKLGWVFSRRNSLLLLPEFEAQFLDRLARSLVTIPTEVPGLIRNHIHTKLLALTSGQIHANPHLH